MKNRVYVQLRGETVMLMVLVGLQSVHKWWYGTAAASEEKKVVHARFVWTLSAIVGRRPHAYSRKTTVVLQLAEYDNRCVEALMSVLNQSGVVTEGTSQRGNQTRRVESSVVKMLFRIDIFEILNQMYDCTCVQHPAMRMMCEHEVDSEIFWSNLRRLTVSRFQKAGIKVTLRWRVKTMSRRFSPDRNVNPLLLQFD